MYITTIADSYVQINYSLSLSLPLSLASSPSLYSSISAILTVIVIVIVASVVNLDVFLFASQSATNCVFVKKSNEFRLLLTFLHFTGLVRLSLINITCKKNQVK